MLTFDQVRPCCASTQLPSSLTRLLKPYLGPSRSDSLPAATCLPFAPALYISLLALCTCPPSLSPFASALYLSLLLPLPGPQWCLSCYQLVPSSSQMESSYSDGRCSVACKCVSTSAPDIFASCMRPEFVVVALKLALSMAIQKPLASWFIWNGDSSDNCVLYWLPSQSAALAVGALPAHHLTYTRANHSLITSWKVFVLISSSLLISLLSLSRTCSCSKIPFDH